MAGVNRGDLVAFDGAEEGCWDGCMEGCIVG